MAQEPFSGSEPPSEVASEKGTTTSSSHKERHTGHGDFVRDSIIGFADGLTVPFALTAGLSSLGSAKLVILGGLAELFAGSISMGIGAYLAAVTELKHYEVEEARERKEVRDVPEDEEREIYEIFEEYGLGPEDVRGVVNGLRRNEDMWVKFMMDFELKLEKPATKKAWIEGLVMGISYFLGGLLPMIPYFAFKNVNHALFTSIGITVVILVAFGYFKARITGCKPKDCVFSAIQTLIVGALAGMLFGAERRGVHRRLELATARILRLLHAFERSYDLNVLYPRCLCREFEVSTALIMVATTIAIIPVKRDKLYPHVGRPRH